MTRQGEFVVAQASPVAATATIRMMAVLISLIAGTATGWAQAPVVERQQRWLGEQSPVLIRPGSGDETSGAGKRAALALANVGEQHFFDGYDRELVVREQPAAREDAASSIPVVRLRQTLLGLPLFGAGVNLVLAADGAVRGISGGLAADGATSSLADFRLSPEAAIAGAIRFAGADAKKLTVSAVLPGTGDRDRYLVAVEPGRPPTLPVAIERLWYPTEHGILPAYRIHQVLPSHSGNRPNARALVVSAHDGRILRDDDLIRDFRDGHRRHPPTQPPAGTVAYRVMADRAGVPYADPFGFTVPHPLAFADGFVPSRPAPGRLLWRRHGGNGGGDPWLADNAQQTRGNNVDAFFKGVTIQGGRYLDNPFDDWTFDFRASHGDFRTSMSSPRQFDYYYDVARAPDDYFQHFGAVAEPIPVTSVQLNAKIVQSFYTANWLHDLFHGLGFDEAAGNMQQDNFGRGGIEGDPLMIYAGFPVTFAYTPDDGIPPALALGLNAFSLSNRDVSGFDFAVVAHEWAHVMFGRLTTMAHTGQPGALNEGTADFIGVFLMLRAEDRFAAPATGEFHGAYAFGAYNNLDYDLPGDAHPPAGSPGNPDNTYYHGVRRFPYSASLAINPLTFGHISAENPLPDGFEPFDWKGRGTVPHEIHTAGEVWASALWQCARNILVPTRTHSEFDTAHRRTLAYLVAGLKLFPVDATYTEARDSVLMAVRSASEDDYRRCRAGFAERGLGANAVSPPRDSVQFHGVVESFVDADPPALR